MTARRRPTDRSVPCHPSTRPGRDRACPRSGRSVLPPPGRTARTRPPRGACYTRSRHVASPARCAPSASTPSLPVNGQPLLAVVPRLGIDDLAGIVEPAGVKRYSAASSNAPARRRRPQRTCQRRAPPWSSSASRWFCLVPSRYSSSRPGVLRRVPHRQGHRLGVQPLAIRALRRARRAPAQAAQAGLIKGKIDARLLCRFASGSIALRPSPQLKIEPVMPNSESPPLHRPDRA